MPGASFIPSGKVFKDKVIVLQGKFPGKYHDHTTVAKLIRIHGGEVQSRVTEKTNIVVTTLDEFRHRSPNIQRAIDRGKARCRIVVWEFIEDSVINRKPSRVSANYYEVDQVLKRMKRHQEAKSIYTKKFVDNGRMGKLIANMVPQGLYHIYKDQTGFEYKVVISRAAEKNGKKRLQKWTLILFESNASPVLYMFGAKFDRGAGYAGIVMHEWLNPTLYDKAFRNFKTFFKKKTGIPWDQRLDGIKVQSLEVANETGTSKETDETIADDKMPFVYHVPHVDNPRGVLPAGWVDPVQAAIEKEEVKQRIRLAKAEEARRLEIAAEEKKLAQMKEDQEKMKRMIEEDEEETDESDDGYDPPNWDD